MCDMTHSYVWHGSFICVTWLVHMCDMARLYVYGLTRSYVRHDAFICVAWLIHKDVAKVLPWDAPAAPARCDMTRSCVWHDSFICVTWLLHVCYMWCISLICVTWLIHMYDMRHSHVQNDWSTNAEEVCWKLWHNSFVCVTQLIQMWRDLFIFDMTHSHNDLDGGVGIKLGIHLIFQNQKPTSILNK